MMGGALMRGLVSSGTVAACDGIASDVSATRLEELATALPGLRTIKDNRGVQADVVVVGVEPKDMSQVCAELAGSGALIVSLAAGVTLASLEGWLPPSSRVVRVMPNTPCVVGEMAAGYAVNGACSSADSATVGSLLGALGSALRVQEEDLDAVTGVAGSAPAYVFQFIEALSDGGVRMGLARAYLGAEGPRAHDDARALRSPRLFLGVAGASAPCRWRRCEPAALGSVR